MKTAPATLENRWLAFAACAGLFLFGTLAATSACDVVNGTVACDRDQDCPRDAGVGRYCTRWENRGDGGTGTCTPDDFYDGDFVVDAGPDAGTAMPGDGGPMGDGGGGGGFPF